MLRLPPYHCQYYAIELAWGLMKRDYDKHIKEYGEFTEEKCLNVWSQAIQRVTPAVWKRIVDKVDRLIVSDWKTEGSLLDSDKTDYSALAFSIESSSESEFDFLEYNKDVDDPIRVELSSRTASACPSPPPPCLSLIHI